ncbi:uncharacterized protein LACBIDRAFT_305661 [Laccaria bicolor S238N-H82]|uniref:Predicted protein n=1 Tax=Laccaria bicolor (strain S238N-H82 / ATCC MYA-4686) TaxID=486041 RepID=B0CUR9_LACBS|nr:uncharacterized protein LACBIDRAFT_305661 [Laccaria bicolor S238N-H82]EDR14142.1 predicted protein [Laccaria bicolor S238N-H82]|eukprot:XP_001874701.1 predicted protein [Laccaria bicolor S238N-H82]
MVNQLAIRFLLVSPPFAQTRIFEHDRCHAARPLFTRTFCTCHYFLKIINHHHKLAESHHLQPFQNALYCGWPKRHLNFLADASPTLLKVATSTFNMSPCQISTHRQEEPLGLYSAHELGMQSASNTKRGAFSLPKRDAYLLHRRYFR